MRTHATLYARMHTLRSYSMCSISTDHELLTIAEAAELVRVDKSTISTLDQE